MFYIKGQKKDPNSKMANSSNVNKKKETLGSGLALIYCYQQKQCTPNGTINHGQKKELNQITVTLEINKYNCFNEN